jgi:phosphoribosylformylglycinamidine synthase
MPDLNNMLKKILSSFNVSSKEWIVRQYDHEVRGRTVIKPLQGILPRQTHGDASVIKPLEDSYGGIALTTDVNPFYMTLNPYWGACSAVDETCRNLTAVGSRPDSLADCLNFGNPEKPSRLGEMYEAVKGIGHMASMLGLPFISGNVSFYNESPIGAVPPTPTILGIGIIEDIRNCITADFKKIKNSIYLIGETKREMGGSEYYKAMGLTGGRVPRTNPAVLKENTTSLKNCIDRGFIEACHDITNGGLAACLSEMTIGGHGAEICLYGVGDDLRSDIKLFSESNTRWLAEVTEKNEEKFEKTMKNTPIKKIGSVKGASLVVYDGDNMQKVIDLSIQEMASIWKEKIWQAMG